MYDPVIKYMLLKSKEIRVSRHVYIWICEGRSLGQGAEFG